MVKKNTYEEINALANSHPRVRLMLDRHLVDSYDGFIKILYQDLDEVIQTVQERKSQFFDADEDRITIYIVDLLRQLGYYAEHDAKTGGHVDIIVRGPNHTYTWLGEAKRDYGASWYSKGLEQLCGRYSDGGFNRSHGGFFIYCQRKLAKNTLEQWREKLIEERKYRDLTVKDCGLNPKLAFISTHIHEVSGIYFNIRHMAIALYHNPS